MKKNILLLLLGMVVTGSLMIGCDDDDDGGKAVNVTIKNATYLSGNIFKIDVTEDQPMQLEAFIMPQSAANNTVTYKFAGEPTGAFEMTESGLITPLAKTPAEGDIPSPLATDTIIATVKDGSATYVRYPVRVMSKFILVSSITIQSAGQSPEVENGKMFDLAQYITINPTNATDKTVTYSSEDENIATIDQNGLITVVGEVGQSVKINVTANDRNKATATCILTVVAETPEYLVHPVSNKWKLSSNIGTTEGDLYNLLDDKNSTFWAPAINQRPIYDVECWVDIDLGETIKFGKLGYRHRSLNYSHLQCHTFELQAKKEADDDWIDFGEKQTEALQVDNYQLFDVEPTEVRYIRITFIKGHLRSGKTDWDYTETGNVSVGDLLVYIYNR